MIVTLDANIICQDYHMSGIAFRLFFDGLDVIPARLRVSEVVVDEVVNRYSEDLIEAVQNIEKASAILNRISGTEIIKSPQMDFVKEKNKYRDFLTKRIADVGGEVIPYPEITHKEVVARDLSRKKPFNRDGKGYRDFLIWKSVKGLAFIGDNPVVFISNNTGDFGDETGIHPDLKNDMFAGSDLRLYSYLKKFNEIYVSPKLTMLDDLKVKLQDNKLSGFDLKIWLKKELLGLIKNESWWELIVFAWPEGAGNVWPNVINEYSDITVDSVRELKSGEKILRISVSAKVNFTVNVDWEQYEKFKEIRDFLGSSEPFSSASWDTTENIKIKASIILNPTADLVVSQSIDAIDGPGIGVENNSD